MNKSRNEEVITAWIIGTRAENHRGSLTTDGKALYSYSLQIGDTCEASGLKILRDHTAKGNWRYYSQTTSCHVGLARRKADVIS